MVHYSCCVSGKVHPGVDLWCSQSGVGCLFSTEIVITEIVIKSYYNFGRLLQFRLPQCITSAAIAVAMVTGITRCM